MFKILRIAMLAVIIFSACQNGKNYSRLESAAALLESDKVDSAYLVLKSIRHNQLTEKEQNFFNLLYTQTTYRLFIPIQSDSLINSCADFYQHRDKDTDKLCEALFYKGMIQFSLNQSEQAVISLKEAEELVEKTSSESLKHKIYNGLVTVNYATANYYLAYKYAQKELLCSQATNNKQWIAFAYNHLACAYEKIGMHDSAYHYIKEVIPLIYELPDNTKAYNLSNIGLYYLSTGDTTRAKNYLTKAYKISPMPNPSCILARLYYMEGNSKTAFMLLNKALAKSDLENSILLKETMQEMLYKSGKYKEAGNMATDIKAMKDSLELQRHTARIQELQLNYDSRQAANNSRDFIVRTIIAFCIGIIIAATCFWFYRRNRKKEDYSQQLLIKNYHRRIAELEALGQSMSKEMDELKQNLNNAKQRKASTIACGHALYENITKGANTVSWTKNDFDCFLEYYKAINPDLFITFEKEYTNLSSGNKFLLVLQDMQLDNEQIKHILGFSSGALRSARFRIRSKKNDEKC